MTRKHYQMVADALRHELIGAHPMDDAHATVERIAIELADAFRADNPLFDRELFLSTVLGA